MKMIRNCYFDIRPRQSGKTTELLKLANNFKEVNNIFITLNNHVKSNIHKHNVYNRTYTIHCIKGVVNRPRLYTQEEFSEERLKGLIFENVFIDEYLLFKEENQSKIYQILKNIPGVFDVYIKTTPSKMINKNKLLLIKEAKKNNIDLKELLSLFKTINENEIKYLYYNLLTHPNAKIDVKYDYIKNSYDPEAFKMEYQGQFYL